MSNTNEVQVSYIKEVTFGTTPSGALTRLRFTGEGLTANTGSSISNEIDATRMTTDVVRTSFDASGPINIELSYGTFDDLLEGAFQSAGWSSAVVLLSSGSATSNQSAGTISATGIHTNAVVGAWVKIEGFANAASNGYFKILATDTDEITVAGAAQLGADETGASGVTVTMGSQIVNGTTQPSYSIEKNYSDLADAFSAFRGSVVGQFSLEVPSDGFISGSVEFTAKQEEDVDATIGNGSYTDAPTNKSMTGVENVNALIEGRPVAGQANAAQFTRVSMQMNNNLRGRSIIGTLGFISIGAGRLEISGSAEAYFTDSGLYAKYLAFTESAFAFVFEDAAGNAYVLDIPALHFGNGSRTAGEANSDVVAELEWSAKKNATENIMARMVRFPAA